MSCRRAVGAAHITGVCYTRVHNLARVIGGVDEFKIGVCQNGVPADLARLGAQDEAFWVTTAHAHFVAVPRDELVSRLANEWRVLMGYCARMGAELSFDAMYSSHDLGVFRSSLQEVKSEFQKTA